MARDEEQVMATNEDLGAVMAEYAAVLQKITDTEREITSLARQLKTLTDAMIPSRQGMALSLNHVEVTDTGLKATYERDGVPLDVIGQLRDLIQELRTTRNRKAQIDGSLKDMNQSVLIRSV
jgi:cell division septum initiation protein DivIVA